MAAQRFSRSASARSEEGKALLREGEKSERSHIECNHKLFTVPQEIALGFLSEEEFVGLSCQSMAIGQNNDLTLEHLSFQLNMLIQCSTLDIPDLSCAGMHR